MPKAKIQKSKVEKTPQTYEEHLAAAWRWQKTMKDRDHINPPNYFFKVGEQVRLGGQPDCRVEEILQEGKLLLITHADKGEIRGVPYDNHRRIPMLCWWVDLEPIAIEENTEFSRPRIRTQYTQQNLDGLIHTVRRRGLIDSPTYQRDYVWTLENKQQLVKSIFNRSDIGKFVFLSYPGMEERLEVVDGKQRLNAIIEFIEGRFEYEGKTWFQLSWQDKRSFFDIMVQVCELQAEEVKKSDILWLFLALNSGGVPQTQEHIAKAQALYEEALAAEK